MNSLKRRHRKHIQQVYGPRITSEHQTACHDERNRTVDAVVTVISKGPGDIGVPSETDHVT